jgi:hypothetical protein
MDCAFVLTLLPEVNFTWDESDSPQPVELSPYCWLARGWPLSTVLRGKATFGHR